MRLTYIGPDPDTFEGRVPLGEGWPPTDHDEPDEAAADEKVASGFYAATPADPAAAVTPVSEAKAARRK